MGHPNLVFVTGMHRSGTSVAARAVQALGYELGKNLMPGARDNPKGFFEDLDLVAINDGFLKSAGWSWCNIKGSLRDHRVPDGMFNQACNFINDARTWGKDIALKDPRFSITWPVWMRVIDEVERRHPDNLISLRMVGSYRYPSEIVQSIMLRDGFTKDAAMSLWEGYTKSFLEMADIIETHVCDYHGFLHDAGYELGRLTKSLRTEEAVGFEKQAFDDFVTEQLHRNRASMDSKLPPHVMELDGKLRRMSRP